MTASESAGYDGVVGRARAVCTSCSLMTVYGDLEKSIFAITDLRDKLQGYFRVASVQHYLVIDPDKRLVIHHSRGQDEVVATRIVTAGGIALEPPGLRVAIADFFESPAQA